MPWGRTLRTERQRELNVLSCTVSARKDLSRVEARVAVRVVVAQNGVDRAQQPVGCGQHGALVAHAGGHGAMVAVELYVLGACRPVGALGQDGAQVECSSFPT